MPQETVGYVKLEWTCQKCGARNPGTSKTCSRCGAAMAEGQQFELPEQQQLIKDEKELAQVGKGADIHCPYCGTRNPADAESCSQCGGKLAGGTARPAGQVLGAYQAGPVPDVACAHCGAMNPGTAVTCRQCGSPLARRPAPAAAAAPKPASGSLPVPLIAAAVVILIALCACVYFAFIRTTETAGTVQSLAWERKIDIVALVPVRNSDWADEMPSGATPGACVSKLRNTQSQPAPRATKVCGTPYTIDQGDGTGKVVQDCSYDVYADWCQYTAYDWAVVNTLSATGSDVNPRWPELSLAGGQREGERHESYRVVFAGSDRQYEYSTSDPNAFARFTPGSKWNLQVNAAGSVVSVEPAR